MTTVVVLSERGMDRLADEVDRDMVHPITDAVAEDMRDLVPVLSGDLRATIEPEHGEGYGRVWFGDPSTGVDYWGYVEYGTRNMPAQPYARPALFRVRTR
jgi:HK97 gp10 family phage protein